MLVYLQMIEDPKEKTKFEIIYRRYRYYMYRIALAILKNPQEAEDAVHSAFVKIIENIEKIPEPECIKTKSYIVTIIRNQAIDIYRRKRNHPNVEYIDANIGLCVTHEGENSVAKCMMKLPERQRSILLLKYRHGYDLREIAKMLGITYRNAAQIEQRAKVKLRALCEEEGIEC